MGTNVASTRACSAALIAAQASSDGAIGEGLGPVAFMGAV
jgi:hypothetical protein